MSCTCSVIGSVKTWFFALIPVITVLRILLLVYFTFGLATFGKVHSNYYTFHKHKAGTRHQLNEDEDTSVFNNVVIVLTPGKRTTMYIYIVATCVMLILSPLMPCYAECRSNLRGWLTVYLVYYALHFAFLCLLLIPLLMVAIDNPFPHEPSTSNYTVCSMIALEIVLVGFMTILGVYRRDQLIAQDAFESSKHQIDMLLLRQREMVLPQQYWKNLYQERI